MRHLSGCRVFVGCGVLYAVLVASSVEGATVAAGGNHSLAVKPDGTVWSWGVNTNGQLGDNSTTQRVTPVQVTGLTGVTIVSVAAGSSHSIALTSTGTVWTWGNNGSGRLGDGTTTTQRTTPVQLAGFTGALAVAAGDAFSMVLASNNTVWTFGLNTNGQLGNNSTTNSNVPVQVSSLTDVVAIAAGGTHALALKSNGQIWGWGNKANGRLGDNTTSGQSLIPIQVSTASGLTAASGLSAGGSHSTALKTDGTPWAWGLNSSGQLGDDSSTQRPTPVPSGTALNVTQTAAGGTHTVALLADGTVSAWGANGQGQVGDGTVTSPRDTPVAVLELVDVVEIAAGLNHNLAVTSSGEVWAWGQNVTNGRLGDGTLINRPTPVKIAEAGFAWKVATPTFSPTPGTFTITTSQNVTLACATTGAEIRYTVDGTAPTSSSAPYGATPIPVTVSTTIRAAAFKSGLADSNEGAGGDYVLKVVLPTVSPGTATYTSAQNVSMSTTTGSAELRYTLDGSEPTATSTQGSSVNIGTTTTLKVKGFKSGWTPSDTRTATYTMNFGTLAAPVVSPAAGTYTTSVDVSATALPGATIRYTTGASPVDPTTSSPIYSDPIAVTASTTIKFRAFHPDYTQSPVTQRAYNVQAAAPVFSLAAGAYPAGQLVTVTDATPGATIHYTLSGVDPTATDPTIDSEDTLVLGNFTLKAKAIKAGCTDSPVTSAAYTVTGSLSAGMVSAGGGHTLALRPDGTVWGWGDNQFGQLGDGTITQRLVPIATALTGVTAVAAGGNHSLAITADGSVWAWGRNTNGQLGDDSTTQRNFPVAAGSFTDAVAVAAGDDFSLVLRANGTVWAFGANSNGQLGDASTTGKDTPVQVGSLTGVVAITAGGTHGLAVKSDGSLWAWGNNGSGRLGDGTTTQRTSPVQISVLTNSTSPSGGGSHSLAVMNDATVRSWGLNNLGQLGDGTMTSPRLTPVTPGLSAGVSQVAAGVNHSVVRHLDATLSVWGSNTNGQLGDGTTTTQRSSPFVLASPTNVAWVAAGDRYSIALTADGQVWGWGHNGNGRVGDGTTLDRRAPVQIAEAGFQWKVGTPTMLPAPATSFTTQSVTLSCATPGATIYYSANGSPWTAYQAGTPVQVNVSTTLVARAVKAGLADSNEVTGDYILKVVQPTTTPAGGTYTSAQTVTLATTTTDSVLRYTLDGTEPTTTSTEYTPPLIIGTTTTVKVKGFRTGWAPSDTRTTSYTMNFGTLAVPTISPGSGTFVESVSVTLTSIPGATIRYTTGTNPADPTTTSTIYTDPITVSANGIVKARAYHSDYTQSPVSSATFTIRPAAPVFSVPAGSYAPGTPVAISSSTAGATIRYTLIGADPITTDPTIASGGSLTLGNYTLKAKASKAGCADSLVSVATYTLTGPLNPHGFAAAGYTSSFVVKPDGTVWAWGTHGGQLGMGTTNMTPQATPRQSPLLTGIVALSSGQSHTAGITADGSLWTWGSNGSGQLGDGTATTRLTPVVHSTLGTVTAVTTNLNATVVLRSDGTVRAFGANGAGQVGDGTTTNRSTPTTVLGLSGVVAIASGNDHTLALKPDGTVWAWGSNFYGQIGDNTTTNRTSPVAVPGLSGIVKIGTGANSSYAVDGAGVLWAWGRNGAGQLGIEPGANQLTPVAVPAVQNVVELSGGSAHTVVRHGDGTVSRWGDDVATPQVVSGLAGVVSVSTRSNQTVAVTSDGTVWSWGENGQSELGDGTTTDRPDPIQVSEANYFWKAGTPIFAAVPGTFAAPFNLNVTSATPGATVCVTNDGTEPTLGSSLCLGVIALTQTATVKARAFKDGLAESNLETGAYVFQVATPQLSPAPGQYASAQTVSISTSTPDDILRYTTDGSEPTEASTTYTEPLLFSTGTTLKVKGFIDNWTPSNTTTGVYTYTFETLLAPSMSPVPATYVDSQAVTLTSSVPGAEIRYTTNGAEPTLGSTAYTGPVTLTQTTTLRAKAFKDGSSSPTGVGTYTIQVAPPTVNVSAGSYSSAQSVSLSTITPGATIRYRTDGQEPTTSDPVFNTTPPVTPLTVDKSLTLKAKAWMTGLAASAVATTSYYITLPAPAVPVAAPAGGTFSVPQSVTLTTATSGAVVRYTLDGTEPTYFSELYTAPVTVDHNLTLKARAFKADSAVSSTLTEAYVINYTTVSPPSFSPNGGVFASVQQVTVTCDTPGATIRYTTNAEEPTETDQSITSGAAITVDRGMRLRAKAWKSGLAPSPVRTADFRVTGEISPPMALKSDGTVITWNVNPPVATPVPIASVATVRAGDLHKLALKSDGTVWAWGFNTNGQLGDGTTSTRSAPVQVVGLTGVVAIAAGSSAPNIGAHSLALKSDGTVWAWGGNEKGQLGDGTTTQRLLPTQVPGLTGVTEIGAGTGFSMALKTDGAAAGTVWGWGYTYQGQLGDGTPFDTSGATSVRPTPAAILDGVAALRSNGYHSLVRKADGSFWSWGAKADGAIPVRSPAQVTTAPNSVWFDVTPSYDASIFIDGELVLWEGLEPPGERSFPLPGNAPPEPLATSAGLVLGTDGWIWTGLSINIDASALTRTMISLSPTDPDPDGDGLTTLQEERWGTDPYAEDSNGDGVPDAAAVASGISLTDLDMDDDGVANDVERARGTSPFLADTDGDGTNDEDDAFPLDPTRWQPPSTNPSDVTPPTITLTEPAGAVPLP